MKIESRDLTIRMMLSSGYYRIPRFQRPYSWDRENIQEFWDDVFRDSPSDYFIGSMVVYKDGAQSFGVVDGQQRLTTITILLCALRNLLRDRAFDDLARGIHALIERSNIDNKPEFVVSTETSYPYFQDRIQQWEQPALDLQPLDEERNLQAAFDQLTRFLAETAETVDRDPTISKKAKSQRLRDKLTAIRDAVLNLSLIFVQLDNEDDAYVIFETLNTRGKDLDLTDLVKNHLSKHIRAANRQTDKAKLKWKRLLETIEGSTVPLETDTFIHHFWLSKYDYLPAKSLFKRLRKEITATDAKDFLESLVQDAKLYRSIFEVPYGQWNKQESRIAAALYALSLFRVVQPVPCVLSLIREYKTVKKVAKRHVEDALVAIEKFHFLFTAVTSQRSSGGISKMYALHARQLHEATDTHAAAKEISALKQKLKDRVPSRDEFLALFPEVVYTDTLAKQRKLVKYILAGLQAHGGVGPPIDFDKMTIEHLASQSHVSASLPEHVIGQIGNLLLVTEQVNNKLRNRSFVDKKKVLRDNGYSLPPEVETAATWGAEEITKRTQSLAMMAYDSVWKIQ